MTASALAIPAGFRLPPAARLLKVGQETVEKRTGDATLKLTAALFAGDHWAGGSAWTGPLPRNADPAAGVLVLGEVEREFVSRNLLRDVVVRHRNGIAGREPLWTISPRRHLKKGEKPSAPEQQRIDGFTAALTDWWDESGAWLAVQRALDTALWSGTGHLRLFISAHELEDVTGADGQPARGIRAGTPLADVMRKISVHAPEWNQSAATRDQDGRVTGAVHLWRDEAGRTHYEVHERNAQGTLLHPDLLPGGTDAEGRAAVQYPVPDLLLYELRLSPQVTNSIRRLNSFLDKTLTMAGRNINLGGFTETTILNAQMPEGKWEDDPNSPGKKIYRPARPHLKGAGVTNYVTGFPILKPDPDSGKMIPGGVSTPSIVYKDPTPFDVFKDSLATARELIYDEAHQLHVLITGDAAANGVSRQQAVNDFLSSLEPTRIELEQMLRWLLSTVLGLALHLSGQSGAAQDLRVRVQARTSAVQPTSAEIDTALKLHEAGMISEETCMQRCGVEDVEAERAARAAEGMTPALALKIASLAPAPFIAMRALMLAFPALGITDRDVNAQRAIDLMDTSNEPAGTDPPANPNTPDLNAAD